MSPDRSSERNGSRPPPSYEKTSRTSTGATTLSRLALSGFAAAAGVGFAWAASPVRANEAGEPAATSAATHPPKRPLTVRRPRPSSPARPEEAQPPATTGDPPLYPPPTRPPRQPHQATPPHRPHC